MKAIYLEEPGKITMKEVPKPAIKDDEVLVQIKSVGVCGSDIEYYESGRIGEFVVEKPLILGHEAAGLIVEVGKYVENLGRGDKVALEPGIPCRRCIYCKTGHYNLCPNVNFMATPPSDGAFVEYLSHPADFAYKLPESVSYDEGALFEPLSVGIYATEIAGINVGDRVAILGAGPIGLMTLQAALARGASQVVITDIIPFRLEKALELGASEAINVKSDSIEDQEGNFNKVIQTAGTSETYRQALNLVVRGGKIVQVGHPSAEEVAIDPNLLITRGINMAGSFRYANTYPKALSMLVNNKVKLKPVISKYFPPDRVEQSLRYPKENPDRCIKAIVKFNSSNKASNAEI